ncbi:uncharacterized protein LOC124262740 [Haliotis rubra]|uniref:uncharacterized protein LOC124262740 n=1 Tax=Haliotis rubra TaxID=36100 RepID=UPI001EE53C99|nr:uncharacterized protein LOC124262740 [Haliotis rubra]
MLHCIHGMAGEATPIVQETRSDAEGRLCVSSARTPGMMEDHFKKAHTEMSQTRHIPPDQNIQHPKDIEGTFAILSSDQPRHQPYMFRSYFIVLSKAYTEAHMAMTEEGDYRQEEAVIASPKEEDVNTFSISISGSLLPDKNKEYLNFVFIPPVPQRFDSGLRARGRK